MWTIIFFTSWKCSSFVMGNDDWLSHLSDECQLKCEKRIPKSIKNEKLVFILCSTSDDWPSDPSNKSRPKCKKGPLSHQKTWNACFWITFNFWWSAKRSELRKLTNVKKGPLSHHKMKCSFWITFNFWWLAMQSKQQKSAEMQKKAP